jgi:ParB family chromosome partitioning protein
VTGPAGKKRGLGRGLDALIEKTEPKPDEPVRTLPVASLHPNRFQPRSYFDEAAIEDLVASVRAQGIIQPLVVTPEGEGYAIIAGERRWRAARKAGLEEVPVVVRQIADDREMLELALVENLQRSDLNPIEEAEAYAALQEKFGLTAGQARPLLGIEDPEEQIRLADRAVRDGLSARDLERLAAEPQQEENHKPKKPDRPVEVHTAAAEERLTRRLQTRVEIKRQGKGGRGQLRIHFHSEEELMRLFDVLIERGESR